MTETQTVTDNAVAGDIADPPKPDPPGASDTATLTRGDIGRLIAQQYAGLRLLITRRAGDPQLAADMLNDALCMAWEKWCAGKIERPELIGGYVFKVAINMLHNHSRSVADRPDRRADVEHIDDFYFTADATDQHIEEALAARVQRFVNEVPSLRDRTVLVRFHLNEEDKHVICTDLGLTPLQFDKIVHRARRRLRQLLESEGITGSEMLCLLCLL